MAAAESASSIRMCLEEITPALSRALEPQVTLAEGVNPPCDLLRSGKFHSVPHGISEKESKLRICRTIRPKKSAERLLDLRKRVCKPILRY